MTAEPVPADDDGADVWQRPVERLASLLAGQIAVPAVAVRDALVQAIRGVDEPTWAQAWRDAANYAGVYGPGAVFVCPDCEQVNRHAHDVQARYCGRCHWWTGDPELGPARRAWQPDAYRQARQFAAAQRAARDAAAQAAAVRAVAALRRT